MEDRIESLTQKRSRVRVLFRPQRRTHTEPLSVLVEQFLAMLRFESLEKLVKLPIDLMESGRDDFDLLNPLRTVSLPTQITGW